MQCKRYDAPLSIKAADDEGRISGYGSVFGNVDLHKDRILPGAFQKSLEKHAEAQTMPAMLWQHDMQLPIGHYDSLEEDSHGLKFDGQILIGKGLRVADEAHVMAKHRLVKGMSIGFNIPKGGESYLEDEGVWEIKEIDLVEISLVTYPANPEAQIAAVKDALGTERKFERFLREAGLSRSQAQRLMSGGYNALVTRDADQGDEEALNSALKSAERLIHSLTGGS